MATLKSIKNKYLTASDGAVLGVDYEYREYFRIKF